MTPDGQENCSFKFEIDEKVLNKSKDGLLYEAKVIKRLHRSKGAQYFLHFAGWKKTYDEWIFEDKLLKYTPANLRKKEEILRKNAATIPRKALTGAKKSFKKKRRLRKPKAHFKYVYYNIKTRSTGDSSETPSGVSSEERSADLSDENEDENEDESESLKSDPEVKEPTITEIIAGCLENMSQLSEEERLVKTERLQVLKECFDALIYLLLSEDERPGYQELVGDPLFQTASPSDAYGMSHLKRFLGEMELMTKTLQMSEEQKVCMIRIAEELSDFVKSHFDEDQASDSAG